MSVCLIAAARMGLCHDEVRIELVGQAGPLSPIPLLLLP
jgi:hypothetical protein